MTCRRPTTFLASVVPIALQDAAATRPALTKDDDDQGHEAHAELEDKDAPAGKSCWSFLMCCWASKKPTAKPVKDHAPQYTDEHSKGEKGSFENGEQKKVARVDPAGKTAVALQPTAPPSETRSATVDSPAPATPVPSASQDTKSTAASNDGENAAAMLATRVQMNGTSAAAPAQPAPSNFTPLRPTKSLLAPLPEGERRKKTLVLDLDETLVHSSFKPIPNADFVISIELENVIHRVFVLKRPGVDAFLRAVGQKFEVVVFTASLAKYADPLLDILDRNKVVKTRLFREACVHHYGNYVKDLSHLGRRLEDSIIIDNSPFSYMFQPDNAIPITSWFNDKNDRQLYDLLPFLDSIVNVDDVCTVLHRRKAMQLAQGQSPQ